MNTESQARQAISDLLAEYSLLLDEDRLEAWLELFVDECEYRIVSRENVEQGLPNIHIWCKGKDMLADRITSFRHVNEYNLHWARRVIGPPRVSAQGDGSWQVETSYSLFQTNLEGVSRLFSVGRYAMRIVPVDGRARLKQVHVIADTASIPTLLAAPI